MRFKARYQSLRPIEGKYIERWTTIDSDTLPQADKMARQYQGKLWRLISVKQQLYATD